MTYSSDTGMVSKHQTTNPMIHGNIRTLLRKRNLNTGRTPRNKGSQSSLSDSQQTLMHISWINLALNDIKNGDVATLLAWICGDHAVLGLEETTHDVENSGFSHGLGLLDGVACEGCVGGHEEMTAGCRNKGGYDADKVVMHIAWVSEGSCTGRHDGRNQLVCLLEGRLLDM